jgi:hypothetical protein
VMILPCILYHDPNVRIALLSEVVIVDTSKW